jgi:hypothetical protein
MGVADDLLKRHTFALGNTFGINQPIYKPVPALRLASTPSEQDDATPPRKRPKQSPQETTYLDDIINKSAQLVSPVLSGLGYIGSSGFDAILGRRVRAGAALLAGQAQDKNLVGELFTVPFISDFVGWTDRETQVTGSDLLGGWDDPDTVVDGLAEFAVEVLTDPLSYAPGLILGAAGKGGKIVQSAGFMDDVTKGLSKKLGRRVGRSEARVLASLKESVMWSQKQAKTKDMSKALMEKWNAAAIGQGYKDIDDALANIGDKMIGGRIGVTWNPVGEAIKTFGTGPKSQATLRWADKLGQAAKASPAGRVLTAAFDSRARDAGTAEGQERLIEMASLIENEQYAVRYKTGEKMATLSKLGLEGPRYREAVIGMVEGSVKKQARKADQIYEIAADDRRIDEIIRDNLESSSHPAATDYRNWVGYEPLKELIKDFHDELASDVIEHSRLGLGNKKLSEIMEKYLPRHTKSIGDAEIFRYKPPTAVTRDMERRLKAKGYTHQEIYSWPVEEAAEKAGYRWKEAEELVRKQQKLGPFAGARGQGSKTANNFDTSMIRRKEFMKGFGGSGPIDLMAMDTRLSGPLADLAQNPDAAAKLIFSEYMNNNPKLFEMMNGIGKLKKGNKYGPLAGLHPHALNKKADDIMTKTDARILNDSFEAMYSARLTAEEMAGYLRELDPRYSHFQIPLFYDDLPSRHMKARVAVRNTFGMAKASLRMLKDGASDKLARGQGTSVLAALRESGFDKRAKRRLAAYLRENGQVGDLARLENGNPYHMIAKEGDKVIQFVLRGQKYDINADWIDHAQKVANVMFKYGASPGRKASRKAIAPILNGLRTKRLAAIKDKIKARIKAGTATPKMEKVAKAKYKTLRLNKSDLAKITQRATAKGSKLVGDNLSGLLRESFYNDFVKGGGKVIRVASGIVNDARKSMDLARDPDVMRGFLGVWDKITNTIKSKLTGEHIPYLLRNTQGLAIMDYIYGAESAKGIVDFLNPMRAIRFAKRWRRAVNFHAGEDIKGAHKMPYFSKTDWQAVADDKFKFTGVKHVVDKKFKDAVATDHIRLMAMASEVAPIHRSSEVMADRLGIPVSEFSTVGELIPGIGRNKARKPEQIPKAAFKKVASLFSRKAVKSGDKKVNWAFINPLEVRGGFMKRSNELGTSEFLPAKVGEWANDYADRIGRTATWLGLMEEGVDPVESVLRSNAMHVDYNKMSSFERKVAKRVVPFYSFQRKMLSYFLRDAVRHPGGATANMVRAINVSTGEGRDQNKFVPQQLAGQLAVPLYRNGNVQSYLKPDLPVEVLNDMVSIGPDAYSTFQNTVLGWASQLHFIPKSILETAFGKSTFQKGRRLEDMYSRIGTKDPILNQIVMASPISRYISMYGPRGTLFDERKTGVEKAASLIAGVPIATIDMEKAAREGLRDAIGREARIEEGVSISERYYITDEEKASDRAKELISLQNSLEKRGRIMRKKLAADAKRNEEKRRAPPVP